MLYDIEYENDALLFHGELRRASFYGQSQGGRSLRAAFVFYCDLNSAPSRRRKPGASAQNGNLCAIANIAETTCAFYVPLGVKDQPGVLAAIAQILGNNALWVPF